MSERLNPPASAGGLYALIEQLAAGPNCSNPHRPYLAYENPVTRNVQVYRPDCGLWSCPQCALRNRTKWAHRIAQGVQMYMDTGERWSFGTLTANRWRRGFGKSLADWRHHWPVLYRRIKRYVDPATLHFVMLPEVDSKNTVHMHVLWSAVFPGKKVRRKKDGSVYYRSQWLADNCNGVGLGYIHDNRPLGSALSAANYVTKYVTKALDTEEWPPYLRRVRTSHHWPVSDPDPPANGPDWQTFTSKWFLWDYLQWMAKSGYTVNGVNHSG